MEKLTTEERDSITISYNEALTQTSRGCAFELSKDDWSIMQITLCDVLREITEKAKVRYDWEPVMVYDRPSRDVTATRKLSTLGIEFRLHAGILGIELELWLCNEFAYEIPSMKDSFWLKLSHFMTDFDVKYELYNCSKNYPNEEWVKRFEKFKNSSIFSLMFDFLSMQPLWENPHESIGSFHIPFTFNDSWKPLIPRLKDAVSQYTTCVYPLYRSHYLKSKRKKSK